MKIMTQIPSQFFKGERMKKLKFENLKGKILSKITGSAGDDEIIFTTNKGDNYKLYYDED